MITSLSNRQTYAGTGSVGPFGFTFKIFNPATDLKVTKLSVIGTETPLVYLADYTVVGIKAGVDAYGAGGTVTLNVALAVGESLTIRRAPPNVQGLSVQNAGPFFPKGYEDQLDYLVMLVQSHEDILSRSFQMKETTDISTGVSPIVPTPLAGALLGWDPTGKKVVNTSGTPGPAGVNGPPVVADAAARDALFGLAPAANQQARQTDIGRYIRFDQTKARWLPEGVTFANGPVVSVMSKGGIGDGAADDTQALIDADAAAQLSGGMLYLDPGTFKCTANITLVSRISPISIGKIKPVTNILVNVAGDCTAVSGQMFDRTGGGAIQFFDAAGGPNKYIAHYRARWFGVLGNGVTDDALNLMFMTNCVPDQATVEFARHMIVALSHIWPIINRTGLTFLSHGWPMDALTTHKTATFKWIGADDGIMIGAYNSGYPTFVGFFFDCQQAITGLDIDQWSISSVAGTNQIAVDASGAGVSATGNPFFKWLDLSVPMPVILSSAGPGAGQLVTTITAADPDGVHATIAVNASTSRGNTVSNNPGSAMGLGANPLVGPGRITTWARVKRCKFVGGTGNPTWIGIRGACFGGDNTDFNIVEESYFAGNSQSSQFYQLPQTSGQFAQAIFNVANAHGGIVGWASPGASINIGVSANTMNVTNPTFVPKITVAAPGAPQGALTIPVAPLLAPLAGNEVLFLQRAGSRAIIQTAFVSAPALLGAVSISVNPLSAAVLAGDLSLNMEGSRMRVEGAGAAGAGPNGTRGPLDVPYMEVVTNKQVRFWTDSTKAVPVNAQVTVNLAALGHEPHFHVGQSMGTGVYFGKTSPNTHQNKIRWNQFVSCGTGFRQDGGSFHADDNWSTDCEIAWTCTSGINQPCTVKRWNSENDRQHCVLSENAPISIVEGRYFMSFVAPSEGYFKILSTGATQLDFRDNLVQGAIPFDGAMFNMSQALALEVESRRNLYFDAQSLTDMGWTAAGMPLNGNVWSRFDGWANPDGVTLPPPYVVYCFSGANAAGNGRPAQFLGEIAVVGTGGGGGVIPADATLRAGHMAFIMKNDNGDRSPGVRVNWGDGTFHTCKWSVRGPFSLTDAANVLTDATKGDFATLVSALANVNMKAPTSPIEGQEMEYRIFASNAAGCAIAWDFGFPIRWAGGAAPVITIAQNKSRKFKFRFTGGIWEESWHSSADIA